MIIEKDKLIVRELAKKYMEIVGSEKQKKMYDRMRDTNDLRIVRPPVILDELPWYQLNVDGELDCVCEDEWARNVERHFRRRLLYLKYFKADNVFEPYFRVKRAVDSTGIGVKAKNSDIKRTDSQNNIISREIEDIFEDESSVELLHDPVFTLRPDKDEANMEFYWELLGDSIPIKQFGFDYYYHTPWDQISFMRGVEPIYTDMYERPEHLHEIMKRFISAANVWLDFIEKNLDVDNDVVSLHCTPGIISGRAKEGFKATWYRGLAQCFGVVSPAMFKEFEIDYIKPIAERFAYTYYGCCEPLDDKIEVLKSISNLRKIGCPPWAKVERCAEQIGRDYVLARKPNPANVAIKTDPEVVRKETEETVKTCLKYGCPCDIVLKDVSTVSGKLENLTVWAETVSDVLDEYYGY